MFFGPRLMDKNLEQAEGRTPAPPPPHWDAHVIGLEAAPGEGSMPVERDVSLEVMNRHWSF